MQSECQELASAAKSERLSYVVFDLLYLDGCDLRAVPLIELAQDFVIGGYTVSEVKKFRGLLLGRYDEAGKPAMSDE
jgi:ATP-dependent DNA ligase